MTALETVRLFTGGLLTVLGAFLFVTALIGNFRFGYALQRMHAAGLGDTLGVFSLFLGITVLEGVSVFTLKLWLALILLWIASPTASHRILRMEMENGAGAGKEKK